VFFLLLFLVSFFSLSPAGVLGLFPSSFLSSFPFFFLFLSVLSPYLCFFFFLVFDGEGDRSRCRAAPGRRLVQARCSRCGARRLRRPHRCAGRAQAAWRYVIRSSWSAMTLRRSRQRFGVDADHHGSVCSMGWRVKPLTAEQQPRPAGQTASGPEPQAVSHRWRITRSGQTPQRAVLACGCLTRCLRACPSSDVRLALSTTRLLVRACAPPTPLPGRIASDRSRCRAEPMGVAWGGESPPLFETPRRGGQPFDDSTLQRGERGDPAPITYALPASHPSGHAAVVYARELMVPGPAGGGS